MTFRKMPSLVVALCFCAVAGTMPAGAAGGPGVGKWTTAGLAGGYVESIAVHPTIPETILAGTRQGVFLSRDGAATWRAASIGLTQLNVRDVTFDREDPQVAFAGTTRGLFKSVTGGTEWVQLPLVAPDALEVELLYRDRTRILVNTTWSLKASDDGGLTWRSLYDRRQQIFDVAVMPAAPGVVYLVVRDLDAQVTLVQRSVDGGETWEEMSRGKDVWSLEVDPRMPSTIVGVSGNVPVRSTDEGRTWQESTLPPPVDGTVFTVSRAPTLPDTLYATGYYRDTGKFVLRSEDGGETWSHSGDLAEYAYPAPLAVDAHDPERVYLGTFGNGIAASTDGGRTFAYANEGLAALPARDLAVDPAHPATSFAVTWTRGVFRSRDAGTTWDDVMSGFADPAHPLAPVSVGAVTVDAASDVYASRSLGNVEGSGVIFRSRDRGETWERAGSLPGTLGARSLQPHGSRPGWLLAGTIAGVYKTTDGGASWQAAGPFEGQIEDFAVAPSGGGVYVATGDDMAGNGDASRLYVSRDFGDTWDRLPYPPMRHAISLAVRADPPILYAGSGSASEVAFSPDEGKTWVLRDVDPTNFASSVAAVAVDPYDPAQVLAGTERGGLWLSRDAGLTWIPTNPAVGGQEVYDIAFTPLEVDAGELLDAAPALVGLTLPRRAGVSRVVLPPNAFRRPRITGDARPGETVTCARGRWSRARRFAYSWERGGERVDGAESSSYRVRAADASHSLACRVSARGPGGRRVASSRAVAVP